MQTSSYILDTTDGVPVHVHRWLPDPDTEVRGVLQVAHGMAEHGARYAPLAVAMTARGWAVHADDHRGHGLTAAGEEDLGFVAERGGWASLLDDQAQLTRRCRQDHPGVPVVLLGHSMGSFLVQQYLFTFPGLADGAVLSASDGRIGALGDVGAAVARLERARLGPRGRSRVMERLVFGGYNHHFEPTRTDHDWLSSVDEVVDAYEADPACGFTVTTQLWLDLLGGRRVMQQQRRLAAIPRDLPILLIAGEEDPLSNRTAGVVRLLRAYRRAGLTDVTHRFYPGRHEILNERVRDQVHEDLAAWLDRVAAGAVDEPDPQAV